MLTEYEGKIFNAEIKGDQVSIWKYVFVEGFEKYQTRRGITYFEKTVPITKIGELFSITFIALIGNRHFVVNSLDAGKLNVISDDQEYAYSHGFSELEHGVWITQKSLAEFDGFQMIKAIENSSERVTVTLNNEQLEDMWNKYVKEVSI